MPERTKLEQVARHAAVSTATVSRVINNAGVVKPATRARVLKAVAELNYHPDLHARTLAGGKSRTIGIIVSNLENPFFFDIYRTVENDAHELGFEVVAANTDYHPERLVSSVRLMIGRRVAGLAAIVSEMDPDLMNELAASQIPVVFYDVGKPSKTIANIRVDYRQGIESIVEHLHQLGHRRIGFAGHHSRLGPLNERLRAVTDAAERLNPRMEVATSAATDSLDGGRRAAAALLDGGHKLTAIVCANDIMAVGVLRELRDRGIRVPGDISVTGFDNVPLAAYSNPALTTADIPRERIGHLIAAHLLPDKHASLLDASVVVTPELVIRESTGPVAAPISES